MYITNNQGYQQHWQLPNGNDGANAVAKVLATMECWHQLEL